MVVSLSSTSTCTERANASKIRSATTRPMCCAELLVSKEMHLALVFLHSVSCPPCTRSITADSAPGRPETCRCKWPAIHAQYITHQGFYMRKLSRLGACINRSLWTRDKDSSSPGMMPVHFIHSSSRLAQQTGGTKSVPCCLPWTCSIAGGQIFCRRLDEY